MASQEVQSLPSPAQPASSPHDLASGPSAVAKKRALVIIDVQNDFCPPSGSLAVPDGDKVIAPLNRLRKEGGPWDLVVLTQDWHPSSHASFHSNNPGSELFTLKDLGEGRGHQMMWPDHCVQGTKGAEFHAELVLDPVSDVVVRKGKHEHVDSYSGFGDAFGHRLEKTELAELLHSRGITEIAVGGLALDYCVAYTCKDGRNAGFDVFLVEEACKGIAAESIEKEKKEMEELGVVFLSTVDDAIARLKK